MRPNIYKWKDWFKRRRFILQRARDYSCSQSVMIQQIRNEASNRGLRVSITDTYQEITVSVSPKLKKEKNDKFIQRYGRQGVA